MKKTQFKKFVARYKDLIYSHAYYFTGNTDDAADITQEVLLKLWHHLDKIAPGAVKSWLLKVTRNLCIDHSRQKREVAFSTLTNSSNTERLELDQIEAGLNPEEETINIDAKDRILNAIQKLPPKIKDVIIMREIHDLKYEDIASSMDLPMNSVKVYLHRGRKLLFEYLKPYFG
jgi:RNA polymerase sigma factor (sigma-70 family)